MNDTERLAQLMYEAPFEGEEGDWAMAQHEDRQFWLHLATVALTHCGERLPVGEPPELE